MGKLKTHRSERKSGGQTKNAGWFDLSGVIFEREPYPRPKLLNLTRLSRSDPALSRCVWECIKRRQPALAELLKDRALHEMREFFDGEISIKLE